MHACTFPQHGKNGEGEARLQGERDISAGVSTNERFRPAPWFLSSLLPRSLQSRGISLFKRLHPPGCITSPPENWGGGEWSFALPIRKEKTKTSQHATNRFINTYTHMYEKKKPGNGQNTHRTFVWMRTNVEMESGGKKGPDTSGRTGPGEPGTDAQRLTTAICIGRKPLPPSRSLCNSHPPQRAMIR
jgi:hypothetical protein